MPGQESCMGLDTQHGVPILETHSKIYRVAGDSCTTHSSSTTHRSLWFAPHSCFLWVHHCYCSPIASNSLIYKLDCCRCKVSILYQSQECCQCFESTGGVRSLTFCSRHHQRFMAKLPGINCVHLLNHTFKGNWLPHS